MHTHTYKTNTDLIIHWCLGQNFCVCLRTGKGTIVSVLSAHGAQRKGGGGGGGVVGI